MVTAAQYTISSDAGAAGRGDLRCCRRDGSSTTILTALLLFAVVLLWASAAKAIDVPELLAIDAAREAKIVTFPVTCAPSAPYPVTPSSGALQSRLNGTWAEGRTFIGILFREPCASDPRFSNLFIHVIPSGNPPFICSSAFAIIAGAQQYAVKLTQAGSSLSFCNNLLVETTFHIANWDQPPYFDSNADLMLYFQGSSVATTASLPVYVPSAAPAITPQTGLWWNPNESGSGYMIDVHHGVMVMTIYSYAPSGESLWYIVSGAIVNNVVIGTLDHFHSGQCISCAYRAPAAAGNDGPIAVRFNTSTSATLTLPGGRSVDILPQAF